MKKINLVKGLVLATTLTFATQGLAKTTYLMNPTIFSNDGEAQAVRVVKENGLSKYSFCDVEVNSKKTLEFDCGLGIGDRAGYSDADLDQIEESIKTERKLEYVSDALFVAGVVVNYKIAASKIAARQTIRFHNGTHLFSGVKGYLQNNISALHTEMKINRALILAAGLGVKAAFIDDALDKNENLELLEESTNKSTDGEVVFVDGFDAEESADLLSRALNINKQ